MVTQRETTGTVGFRLVVKPKKNNLGKISLKILVKILTRKSPKYPGTHNDWDSDPRGQWI